MCLHKTVIDKAFKAQLCTSKTRVKGIAEQSSSILVHAYSGSIFLSDFPAPLFECLYLKKPPPRSLPPPPPPLPHSTPSLDISPHLNVRSLCLRSPSHPPVSL